MSKLVGRVGGVSVMYDSGKDYYHCITTEYPLSAARTHNFFMMAKYIFYSGTARRMNDTSKKTI